LTDEVKESINGNFNIKDIGDVEIVIEIKKIQNGYILHNWGISMISYFIK